MEFIKLNNHTNIVLANVSIQYDLSYYLQVNKGIRSYNKILMEIIKEYKQVALIEIDIDRKYHIQHGLHFNKLGKLLFSNKITQAIYSTLGKKLKRSIVMSEKQGIQGGENEADRRNSNQGQKDFRNNKGTIKLIQNYVEERFNQDKDETVSDNSDDKNVEGKYSQINNKVVVSQELECGGRKKGVNKDKTMILEQTQDITDNTQSESVDKIVETRRISTRNKKTPSIRGNDFLW